MKMKRKINVVFSVLFVLMLLTGCNVDQTINDTIDGANELINSKDLDESRERDVYEDAKEIIRQNLASPSSAVFPTFGSDGVRVIARPDSPDTYVSGYVDADNAMGASIRANFTVHIIYEEYAGMGNYKYEIQELG